MGKFKIGDRMKRIDGNFGNVKVGDHEGWNFSTEAFELVQAWQPKVGDRVLCVKTYDGAFTEGNEYVVAYFEPTEPRLGVTHDDNGEPNGIGAKYFGPIPAEEAPVVAQAQPAADAGGGFKAGDRIRLIDSPLQKMPLGTEVVAVARTTGSESAVHYIAEHGVTWRPGKYFELVAPPLTITAGRYYKTRDGRKVGPMERFDSDSLTDGSGRLWCDTGERYFEYDRGGETDLTAIWEEPANDNAEPVSAKPKFKVGDRVRLIDNVASFQEFGMVGRVIDVSFYGIEVDYSPHQAGECTEQIGNLELVTTTPAIVALIEDGEPKPATKPKVHADQAAATTEAERLALEHPGQRFGVFILADSKIADVVEEVVKKTVLRAA